jgi:hypothetical protein
VDGLRAIVRRSKHRAERNDVSLSAVYRVQNYSCGCKSPDQWEAALGLAEGCVGKFNEPVANLQDVEKRADGALELLTKR